MHIARIENIKKIDSAAVTLHSEWNRCGKTLPEQYKREGDFVRIHMSPTGGFGGAPSPEDTVSIDIDHDPRHCGVSISVVVPAIAMSVDLQVPTYECGGLSA